MLFKKYIVETNLWFSFSKRKKHKKENQELPKRRKMILLFFNNHKKNIKQRNSMSVNFWKNRIMFYYFIHYVNLQ